MRRAVTMLSVIALAASCEVGPRPLAWRFLVESDDPAPLEARVDVIEAVVIEGGCGGTNVLFETELVLGDGANGASAQMPEMLGPGTYGLRGRAHDERCVYFLEGCADVTLPHAADVIDVPLMPSPTGEACTPGEPGPGDVTFTIGTRDPLRSISPWIYGMNAPDLDAAGRLATVHGSNNNRWSTHDWETGNSNGGAYFGWSNDGDLARSGEAVASAIGDRLTRARDRGAALIIPLSLMSRVAADGRGDGDVTSAADFYDTRFIPSVLRKPTDLASPPDTTDGVVYQDELVGYVEDGPLARCAECPRDVIWSLDVAPDEWEFSYPELPEGTALTEEELILRSIELAHAIHDADPDAIVMGPYVGIPTLPGFRAAGAEPTGFVDRYAEAFFDAFAARGAVLLDAIAIGYRSELEGVSEHDAGDEAVIEARMHAARMLWDPSYTDGSWVTRDWIGGPLELVPRVREAVRAWLPDAGIAVPRWDLGGGEHVSGAIATADALGVFGREDGMLLASLASSGRPRPYVDAAFAMFRDYDGLGGTFGDQTMPATTSDGEATAIYASTFEGAPDRVVLVAINRGGETRAAIRITHRRRLATAEVFALTAASSTPTRVETIELEEHNALVVTLPARSVTTIALR